MPKNNYDDDDDDLLMALQSMEPCGNCGADGAKIPCMSGCDEVFYCSRECGMHHASAHRLRCRNLRSSKFNDDSDSDESESEYEEFTDDSDEWETDSGDDDDDEEEEEEEEKPKKKKKGKGGKGKRKMTRTESVDASGATRVVVDSEVERRIEEKIMRRLKKQEENRIAQAIEQRMREEKANWKDEEMNRIIMEMRERFQKEIANSEFMAQFIKNNAQSLESQSSADMVQSIQAAAAAAAAAAGVTAQGDNPQAEGKESALASSYGPGAGAAGAVVMVGADDARARSASKESSWNNSCREFEALRVVIWKHSFLPRMKFGRHPGTGIWNAIKEIDGDESFSHISEGDALISINGRGIDEAVQTEEDLMDIFAAFASPLIFKFEAADPYNGKVHDYTVTWSNGPLGVTLKDDCTNQKVPIVNRLTKKTGSVAVKQNIAIGDILVAINNIDTIQLGCSLSMSILKKVQLPAKLKFRGVGGPTAGGSGAGDNDAAAGLGKLGNNDSFLSARPETYIVNWGEGPLGLTIIPGMDENDLPVIKKVTGTGTSVGIEHAQVGDFLETMNNISTEGMPFEDVVSYLKSAPKPVHLKFRSATYGDDEIMVSAPPPPPVMEIKRTPSAQMNSSMSSSRSSPAPSPHKSYAAAPQQTQSAPAPAPAPAPVPVPVPVPAAEIVRDEYKVVWGDGPLGLTIDAREDAPTGAYIKRIASQGAASRLSQDCIGDFLTHINDMDVSRVAFQDIVSQLKASPRPLTLNFKRRSAVVKGSFAQSSSSVPVVSSAPHQARPRMSDTPTRGRKPSAHEEAGIHYYNVVWQDGTPLGLSLRGADNTSDYPYITRVTGNGSAAHLPNSVVGDCLVSVDGRSVHVRDKTFDEVMTMLKNMPKPVTLKFQARTDDQPRGGSTSGMHVPQMQQHQQQQPPAPFQPSQSQSHTWRQNRGGAPLSSASSMPAAPGGPQFASSLVRQQSHQISRGHMGPSDRALDIAAGQEDKFANIQSPFLVQNKLSTGRRQKMLKGLKK